MNQLEIFNFGQNQIRVILKDSELWFVAKDVCNALEIKDARKSVNLLDKDERNIIPVADCLGREQHTFIINEPGLYSLILRSRKQEAKEFKRWITHEVIPSIRKYGAYMTPETLERTISDPDFLIGLLNNLKEERNKRVQAEQEKEKVVAQIKADQPYTSFGKIVSNSTGAITVGAFAKMLYDKHGLKIGRNKMFEWLRENGYLIKSGRERNNPKQVYIQQGLFEVKPTILSRTEGDIEKLTTLITGKGQVKFSQILLKEYEEVI